ncbi:LL-diaminopimelate aminotransferase [Oceanobacillus piezotolerans]|uniref:Aminotransferase n=1 Tax=Oceanobacillus piezotolerans TaxID=2448030 RepID=A0A498D8C0_9BACI|nr:LL-diaminopimelate aminotransferase [Oceanobacillus piezotolerans]RLL45087.1 LL-diaminopimelate aminotransferase [Oceanobacillus piezotolerans]
MKFSFSTKMDQFKTSIFNELAAFKKQKMESGMEIVDLSIGSPDLPPPTYVMEELSTHAKDPLQYGYALTGMEEFHQAIANYYHRNYHVQVDSRNQVLTVMGSQDGLVHLPLVFCNEGDTVLVPDPGYTAYETGISLAGATPYPMPLLEENHFLPDLDAIPEEIKKKAKLLILNFPGNPVPALATEDFFQKVVAFAKENNIAVLHDFAYSELYYENKPISFLSVEGAKEVGIEFNSLSKSFNMAGCRVGYVTGNEIIIDALGRLKSNLDYGIFLPIQRAAVRALEGNEPFSNDLRNIYKRRRDILVNGFNRLGWRIQKPAASMFLWARIPSSYTSTEFAYRLIDEAGIVVTPGNAFGESGEGFVRIAYVQSEKVLHQAVEQLAHHKFF